MFLGSIGTECTAANKRNLICKFPFNVNSTQSDFGVYFYPDDGGEGNWLINIVFKKKQMDGFWSLRKIKKTNVDKVYVK